MKGGVACMPMAIEILKEIGVTLAGDVVFTTVVDEEIGGMGSLMGVLASFPSREEMAVPPVDKRYAASHQ